MQERKKEGYLYRKKRGTKMKLVSTTLETGTDVCTERQEEGDDE